MTICINKIAISVFIFSRLLNISNGIKYCKNVFLKFVLPLNMRKKYSVLHILAILLNMVNRSMAIFFFLIEDLYSDAVLSYLCSLTDTSSICSTNRIGLLQKQHLWQFRSFEQIFISFSIGNTHEPLTFPSVTARRPEFTHLSNMELAQLFFTLT